MMVTNRRDSDIVLVCPHLGDGGTQRVVANLANAWSQKNKKVTIITLYPHEDLYELYPSVRIIRIHDIRGNAGLIVYLRKIVDFFIQVIVFSLYPLRLICILMRSFLNSIFFVLKFFVALIESLLLIIDSRFHFPDNLGWLFNSLRGIMSSIRSIIKTRASSIRSIIKIRAKKIGLYLHIFSRAMLLRQVIKAEDAPVVLSFIGSSNILTILGCKWLGKRVIISERNDPELQALNYPYNPIRPWLYRHADIVTANTESALRTLNKYVPDKKLAYVPNPVLIQKSNNGGNVDFTDSFILAVGRLHEQKAYDILLEAFGRCGPKLKDWRLKIIGQGDLWDTLNSQAQALNISHLVDFYGHVPDPFIYYRNAKIFVLASRHEGMSNALLEAMSCGLAVVVSDSCRGSLELVKNWENGLVVPVNDHIALANAIELLANDEKLRKRLGDAAQRSASRFDISSVLEIWENIIGW